MRNMTRSHIAPAVLMLASAAALAAQEARKPADPPAAEAPPTFPAQVEQVIVDMVVTDKKGNPIRGLKREDITINEDGVAQQIVSFEAVQVPEQPSTTPPPPPRVTVNTAPEERRPTGGPWRPSSPPGNSSAWTWRARDSGAGTWGSPGTTTAMRPP